MVALFLPGVVFIMGAGFVFGFWRGLLAVWVGGAVGQALAFLLARYLLKDWVEKTIKKKWKAWQYIDKAIEHDGWKLVLIMRFRCTKLGTGTCSLAEQERMPRCRSWWPAKCAQPLPVPSPSPTCL